MGAHSSASPKAGLRHVGKPYFSTSSSNFYFPLFKSGRGWVFPDALAYYIVDCGYTPPRKFVEDVMSSELHNKEIHMMHTAGPGHISSGPETEIEIVSKEFSEDYKIPKNQIKGIGWLQSKEAGPIEAKGVMDIDAPGVCSKEWPYKDISLEKFVYRLLERFPSLMDGLKKPVALPVNMLPQEEWAEIDRQRSQYEGPSFTSRVMQGGISWMRGE